MNLQGTPPLVDAAMYGDRKRIELLLRRGADIHATGGFGVSPLIAACMGPVERVDLVRLLLDHGARIDYAAPPLGPALCVAASVGRLQIVRLLLARGATVDGRNAVGMTPLMLAARDRHFEVAAELVRRGARVNARDDRRALEFGRGAFTDPDYARRYPEFLRTHRWKEDGASALDWARFGGDKRILRLLLQRGAK